MGAYLSAPSVEKKSEDFSESEKFSYGVSRMQGWRISMEDAHNCVPSLEDNTSLFGVYDGHGGSEVAMYCALHFSDVLKGISAYKEGRFEDALKETFMSLDKVLLDPETIRELKVLADRDPDSGPLTKADIEASEAREEEEECEENEMKLLHEEATMSIEELLERYGKAANETKASIDAQRAKLKEEREKEGGSSSSKQSSVPTPSSSGDRKSGVSSSSTSDGNEVKTENMDTAGSSDAQDSIVSSSSDVKAESSEPAQSSSSVSSSSGTSSTSDQPGGSVIDNTNTGCSSSSGTADSTANKPSTDKEEKVTSTGEKFQPKLKSVKLKLMTKQEEEGIADDSDSESGEDGFDSDEAVEGSSDDSEEDDDDEDDDEEESDDEDDIDISEIPTITPVSTTIEEPGKDSGTTAVVALLRGHELLVANAGDSRCVLSRDGVAFDMSEDHKPEDDSEIKRIKAAGGHVNMQGRVNGGLNLSRAIGDHCYKTNKEIDLENQMISAMPDVKKVVLKPGDDFMVLACDGIWNVFSSQEVVDFVRVRLPPLNDSEEKFKLSSICEELLDTCLAPDTTGDGTGCDNMTMIVVRFNASWLQKSSIQNSGDAKETNATENIKGLVSNSVNDLKVIENNEIEISDAKKGELNIKINGENENGKNHEDNTTTGCKRPRTENDLDSTDKLDLVEQTTKKQKVA